MRHRISSVAAVSLVEVTLALGIGGFCLLAVFGLLPVGIQANQTAVSQTAAATILASVIADLRGTPRGNETSPLYHITFGSEKTLNVDDTGRVTNPADSSTISRCRVTISFPASPSGPFASTFVRLTITWPAAANPATNRQAGHLETFVALNRN